MDGVFLAIKGNYLDRATEIFECIRFSDNNQDIVFDDYEKCSAVLGKWRDYYNNGVTIRGIWFDNGWTIVNDPELCDFYENWEVLNALYDKFRTQIQVFHQYDKEETNAVSFTRLYIMTDNWFISQAEYNAFQSPIYAQTAGARPISLNEIVIEDVLKQTNQFGLGAGAKQSGKYIVKQLFDPKNPDYTLHKINIEDFIPSEFDEEH